MTNIELQDYLSAPGCTILEPLYSRFDQTCQSFNGIKDCAGLSHLYGLQLFKMKKI